MTSSGETINDLEVENELNLCLQKREEDDFIKWFEETYKSSKTSKREFKSFKNGKMSHNSSRTLNEEVEICTEDEDEFKNWFKQQHINGEINIRRRYRNTYLQYCCRYGLIKAGKYLIEKGADLNKTAQGEGWSPLELACYFGFADLIKSILSKEPRVIEKGIIIECFSKVIKNCTAFEKKNVNRLESFELILKEIKNRNIKEFPGSESPFLLALRYGKINVAMKILEFLPWLYDLDKIIFERANTFTLEQYMNKCIYFDMNNDDEINSDNEILYRNEMVLNYEPWIPLTNTNLRESDYFYDMSTFGKFEPLLDHPIVTCFLAMKHIKMWWCWVLNLLVFVVFTLFWALALLFNDNYYTFGIVTIVGYALLSIMYVIAYIRYRGVKLNNYVKIALGCTTTIVLFSIFLLCLTHVLSLKKISCFMIILSQVILLSLHLRVKLYQIEIFKTVLWNFLKIMFYFGYIILASVVSLYVFFIESEGKTRNNKLNDTSKITDDTSNVAVKSFYTVFTLLVGNIDDEIFYKSVVVNKILVAIIIFLFSVVLINILNGLAVSDVATLRQKAELVTCRENIQYIHFIEVFLSDCCKTLLNNFRVFTKEKTLRSIVNETVSGQVLTLDEKSIFKLNELFKDRNIYSCVFKLESYGATTSTYTSCSTQEDVNNCDNLCSGVSNVQETSV